MEAVEFYIINGQTCIRRAGVEQKLTPKDRDAVEFMLEQIGKYFPDALKRLGEWAEDSIRNKAFFEYRIVDRFIRCNFGEADFLRPDIDDLGMFHLEEVKCPLRGICKDECVICKPVPSLGVTKEELKVVQLYANGLLPGEIAQELGKKEQTCKMQIRSAARKLKLPHPRWLIGIFKNYMI